MFHVLFSLVVLSTLTLPVPLMECSSSSMRPLLGVLFVLRLANGDEEQQFEKEDGVVVLNDKNFDDFLNANPTVLVEFYSPG